MIAPNEFAHCFLETFDKGAVEEFRRWLGSRPMSTKWIIAADFALRDTTRPGDCFAFSIIPYDTLPDAFATEVRANLPKDLKKSKTLSADAAAWLRDERHFHLVIPMNQDRIFYYDTLGTKQLEIVRNSIQMTHTAISGLGRDKEEIRRFNMLLAKSKANSFNVGLFTDLTLLALYLALISLIICRERKPQMVGWFCDRDNMTNLCDGIVWNYATENFFGLANALGIDISNVKTTIALPDKSSGTEVMWFDHYIRSADWLAGTLAAWDRTKNQLPGEQDKYVRMVEDVVADSHNSIFMPVYLDKEGMKVTRLLINLKRNSETGSDRKA